MMYFILFIIALILLLIWAGLTAAHQRLDALDHHFKLDSNTLPLSDDK